MGIDDRQQSGGFSQGDETRRYQQFGYGYPYERFGYGYPYERVGFGYSFDPFGFGYSDQRFGSEGRFARGNRNEHTWQGGLLGWLGAGIRTGAGWFGDRLQQWGSWFGGRLSGETAEIGRAVRGRGERMASALEQQDERAAATLGGARRQRQPRYRRPDERILDDVWHRISVSGADPQDVEVEVNAGVVTLSGRVASRFEKRLIEDVADSVFGVQEVHNHVRVARDQPATGAEVQPLRTNQVSTEGTTGPIERH
jgi:BON domain